MILGKPTVGGSCGRGSYEGPKAGNIGRGDRQLCSWEENIGNNRISICQKANEVTVTSAQLITVFVPNESSNDAGFRVQSVNNKISNRQPRRNENSIVSRKGDKDYPVID